MTRVIKPPVCAHGSCKAGDSLKLQTNVFHVSTEPNTFPTAVTKSNTCCGAVNWLMFLSPHLLHEIGSKWSNCETWWSKQEVSKSKTHYIISRFEQAARRTCSRRQFKIHVPCKCFTLSVLWLSNVGVRKGNVDPAKPHAWRLTLTHNELCFFFFFSLKMQIPICWEESGHQSM